MLGRKLGMTQVFDPEDGHVERVTVLEAGPCFVTAIRRTERDGQRPLPGSHAQSRQYIRFLSASWLRCLTR